VTGRLGAGARCGSIAFLIGKMSARCRPFYRFGRQVRLGRKATVPLCRQGVAPGKLRILIGQKLLQRS